MNSLSRFSISAPRTTLLLCLFAVAALAPGIARLELATDGLALVPSDSPAAAIDREAREFFGVHDQVIVVLRSSDTRGVLNGESLQRLVALTQRVSALPGIGPDRVQSLANERSDHVKPGSLEFVSWLTPLPTSDADLVRLAQDLHDARVYDGTLLSTDSPPSMTACLVDVPRNLERSRFVSALRETLAEIETGDDELHLVGAPIAEATLGEHLLEDLARLIPLSLLCMLGIFFVAFRRPVAALLPLLEVGACLVAVLGLMGWVGAPIYLTIAILPVVLTAVGVADELHLFMHFLSLEGADTQVRVRLTMENMARPVVQTSITTAIGFLSFTLSPLVPVRVFGLFMAIGVLLCMLWSLAAVPALLVLLPARYWGPPRTAIRTSGLARWLTKNRKRAAFVTVLLLVPTWIGLPLLEVQDSWLSGFAPQSEFARSTRLVDEHFGGAHILRVRVDSAGAECAGVLHRDQVKGNQVRIEGRLARNPVELVGQQLSIDMQISTGAARFRNSRITAATYEDGATVLQIESGRRPLQSRLSARFEEYPFRISSSGRMLQPTVLTQLKQLEAFLASQSGLGVGRVLGPYEHLAAMNFMLRLRAPEQFRVPEDPLARASLLSRYANVRGENRLQEILGSDSSSGLITVFLRRSNYQDTQELMTRVRSYAEEELEPIGLRLSFNGDVAVSQSMIRAIVNTQISSLLISLLGILIATSIFLRSPILGIACTLPALLAVATLLGCLGLAGIPLGVATSMFAATVLGIGVDYAIHLVHRARENAGPLGVDWYRTLEAVAAPLILDVLAIGIAFGILAASQVPANSLLGVCIGISLFVCACVTLALLPTCMSGTVGRQRNSGRP